MSMWSSAQQARSAALPSSSTGPGGTGRGACSDPRRRRRRSRGYDSVWPTHTPGRQMRARTERRRSPTLSLGGRDPGVAAGHLFPSASSHGWGSGRGLGCSLCAGQKFMTLGRPKAKMGSGTEVAVATDQLMPRVSARMCMPLAIPRRTAAICRGTTVAPARGLAWPA